MAPATQLAQQAGPRAQPLPGDGPALALGAALVHQLVEAHAARTPAATAVRFGRERLDYQALEQRACSWASFFLAAGLVRGDRVVACLEPSCELPAVLLGVLKAGAVWVPLDPGLPAARLEALLGQLAPRLVLVEQAPAGVTLPPCTSWWCLEEAASRLEQADASPAVALAPEDIACIYFTSGTTGQPKAAQLSHGNLRHALRAAQDRFDLGPADVMPALARFAFSISFFELLAPLISGATLLLVARDHVLEPARLAQALRATTFVHLGPALLRRLVVHLERHPDPQAYSNVRHVSSGGDVVPAPLLAGVARCFPRAEVFVIYGCTEIACMGTAWRWAPEAPDLSRLGRPFCNQRVRLLDGAGARTPPGSVGEIHFAGPGVSPGYLPGPGVPAAADHRFLQLEGHRYYRTGDLGRLASDGALEFLGRADHQLQLRGLRIEPGEVEHHLLRAPGVQECAVGKRPGRDGEETLVGYVVGGPGAGPVSRRAVRLYLRSQLPEQLVPAVFVQLERLPRNANGKLDRAALAAQGPGAPEGAEGEDGVPFRAPETRSELLLSELWRDVLDLPRAGLDDLFFDSGGDSLRALALLQRLEQDTGVTLAGLELVREPLGVLAALLEERSRKPGERSAGARTAASMQPGPAGPVPESFHFGAGQSLYGVYHPARGAPPAVAALLCAPLAAEALRTHFVLQRLARKLAARGVAVLRFDLFGEGDSLGDGAEASCRRWEQDLLDARDELVRRSGARQVTVVGVRLAAALLRNVLPQLAARSWVLWDPVCAGADWVREATTMQLAYQRNVRWRRRFRPATPATRDRGSRELAGATRSAAALSELEALSFNSAPRLAAPPPLRWLETSSSTARARQFEEAAANAPSSRFELLPHDSGWGEIERLEQVLPDVGFSSALARMVLE